MSALIVAYALYCAYRDRKQTRANMNSMNRWLLSRAYRDSQWAKSNAYASQGSVCVG